MMIRMSTIFGRKDASHFSDKWIPIIHQVITYESILNWSEIIIYIFQFGYSAEESAKGA